MKFSTAAARHQSILSMLQDCGEVRISTLTSMLGVTTMTAWRDLKYLDEQGLLARVRGGAVAKGGLEPEFEFKSRSGSQEKQRICRTAAKEFLHDAIVIAMEGGSTVAGLVPELPDSRISIVTNSLPIALSLRQKRPALPVRLPGGWLSSTSGNTVGPGVLRDLRGTHVSVCFLGATGWDANRGPMDPNPLEIEVKRALAAAADQVVLLMESRKFGVASASVLLHPKRIHALVTDAPPPPSVMSSLVGAGVRIIIAAPDGCRHAES